MADSRGIPVVKEIEDKLEEEIDFKAIFDQLIRYRNLITKFAIGGLAVGSLICLTAKKTWEGQFQIVLQKNNEIPESAFNINPRLAQIAGLENNESELNTEVGILESPSILMNIFEFVKDEKIKAYGDNVEQSLKFKDWRKDQLSVNLEQGTAILNLAYRDTDKKLIIPVLDKISSAYQKYSGKRRLRRLELGMDFFESQISLYKRKSNESFEKAQQYGIDNDLSILSGESEIDKEIIGSINIEAIRVQAANEIRLIDEQLSLLDSVDKNSDEVIYIASILKGLANNITGEIKSIERTLSVKKFEYKETDRTIIELKRRKQVLLEILGEQLRSLLDAKRKDAQARLKSSERPKDVLITYRKLISDASKDQFTLDKLEDDYRLLLLEKARYEDPWELITRPTLLPSPVSPKKLQILALSLVGGLILGSGVSLIDDKKKNIIFTSSEIKRMLGWPFLTELRLKEKSLWEESLELLIKGKYNEKLGSLSLLIVGEINNKDLEYIKEIFKRFIKNSIFVATQDIREASNLENIIVLAPLGSTNRSKLIEVKNKLLLQKTPILGIMTIKNF